MLNAITLSELTQEIQNTFDERFAGQSFWISAEISDVKKQSVSKRCYLKLIERSGSTTLAELKAVFWSNSYDQIEAFEKSTKQEFVNGLKIICLVKVRFHQIYGLNADLLQIDIAHSLGTIELERQATLDKLLKENPNEIQQIGEYYRTLSNSLPLPIVVQRIALITAVNSDGQRDFLKEISENKFGYQLEVREYLCTIQGDTAHELIIQQLNEIEKEKDHFDVVAIVRGGGSQTDFKPFEKYDLAKKVALFPLPIFTGIGHDRNISIVDLMARPYKTPTKVAAQLIEYNFEFENLMLRLKERFDQEAIQLMHSAKEELSKVKRLVKMASPSSTLKRGFAIISKNKKIVVHPSQISLGDTVDIELMNEILTSQILKKEIHEKGNDL
jgi:exodeoxyribonuclease VII large subunit